MFDLIEVNRIVLMLMWWFGLVCGLLLSILLSERKPKKPKLRSGTSGQIRHGRLRQW